MTYAPFDVVVVPFPYSDVLAEKRRPAVVISDPALQKRRGLVWVAMVTSSPGPMVLGDAGITDLDATGLKVPCRVRGSKVAAIDARRVVRRAGALGEKDATVLRAALKACAAF